MSCRDDYRLGGHRDDRRQSESDRTITPPVHTVVQLIVSALLFRVLTRQDLDEAFADRIVDVVFEGIEAQ
ncbi:hypothetical protein OG225_17795 [Nocardia sp. NBC_01377]|uniref:hypothetical protein n=1 Tax=Nocardia sp. NBC_01377 TaxID=2903595 RepID=UPI00324D2A74